MYSNNWGGRREGAGRPRGSIDARPRELREAMLNGAILSKYGKDREHPDQPNSLENFFKNVADDHLADFLALLSRLIPRQINSQVKSTIGINIEYRSIAEVKNAMLEAGMTVKQIEAIENALPTDDILEEPVTKRDEP